MSLIFNQRKYCSHWLQKYKRKDERCTDDGIVWNCFESQCMECGNLNCKVWMYIDNHNDNDARCTTVRVPLSFKANNPVVTHDMLDVMGWTLLSQRRQEARLILFYKIINGVAQVPFENVLVEVYNYKGTILQHIVNLCLTTKEFPISCKSSIIIPLIKKPGLDREMLKNYRPVSNLSFLSKVIEKVIYIRILGHILDNNIVDSFQSAYRAGHSCETALLRVYNDIVTTVGKGNGSFLVLLDLSAAFDTIDHDNLFYILEKYVGIGGSALRLIRSYFSDRRQRVQIDGIMFDFASLLCGVPQGSVLGPMKFCLYLLPLGAILRHHNIGYHIYADDTQLYISFKCKDPLESLTKLNMCISESTILKPNL